MSVNFAALTSSVGAGLSQMRACLIASRDGLVLGAHPPDAETGAMEVWMRIAALGPVERGFAVVGDEVWAFYSRGSFQALAIAGAATKPAFVLLRLEQALETAEREFREEAASAADPVHGPGRAIRPASAESGSGITITIGSPESVNGPLPAQAGDGLRHAQGPPAAHHVQAGPLTGPELPPWAALDPVSEDLDEPEASVDDPGRPSIPSPSDQPAPAQEPSGEDPAAEEGGRLWKGDSDTLVREFAGLLRQYEEGT
jgi:hypothetical protein